MKDHSTSKKLQILNSVDQFCKQYGPELNPIRTQILVQSLKDREDCDEILKGLNDKEKKKIKKILDADSSFPDIDNDLREKISNKIEAKIQSDWSVYSFNFIKKLIPTLIIAGILFSGIKYLFFPDYWRASYFSNKDLTGTPFGVYNEQNINHNWGVGSPKKGMSSNNFSARFESVITMSENDSLTFKTISDDGIRLFIDDELILDFWYPQDSIRHQATKELEVGQHLIRVEYFEAENGAKLNLEIESTKDGSYKLSLP